MADKHITLPSHIDSKLRNYCKNNNLNYSQGVCSLIEIALNNLDINKQIELHGSLLSKIYSKSIYTIDLVEQLYSDLEIENNTNPKDNKSLQEFKINRFKDKFDD